MKKRLLIIGAALCVGLLVGCGNQTFIDTNYTYNRAIIKLANDEVIEVEVKECVTMMENNFRLLRQMERYISLTPPDVI